MIEPTGFHVLVEMDVVEETTESGIIVATKTENKREQGGCDIGRVIAIGPTAHLGYEGINGETPKERAAQWGYKVGDRVLFERYAGKLLDIEGFENHRVITDSNIKLNLGA